MQQNINERMEKSVLVSSERYNAIWDELFQLRQLAKTLELSGLTLPGLKESEEKTNNSDPLFMKWDEVHERLKPIVIAEIRETAVAGAASFSPSRVEVESRAFQAAMRELSESRTWIDKFDRGEDPSPERAVTIAREHTTGRYSVRMRKSPSTDPASSEFLAELERHLQDFEKSNPSISVEMFYITQAAKAWQNARAVCRHEQ